MQRTKKLEVVFRELPGPVEGAPINSQRYVPLHEIVYGIGEITTMKNNNASLWVVGVKTVELGILIEIDNIVGHIPSPQIYFPPLSIVVSFQINNTICIDLGHHGEVDIAHEYTKSKMRLLSSPEGLCTIFMPFSIPILVGKSGNLLVTKADSVLWENLNELEKPVFDFRPHGDHVLVKIVRDGGSLHDLQQFGRL